MLNNYGDSMHQEEDLQQHRTVTQALLNQPEADDYANS